MRHKKGEEMVTTVSLDYVSNKVALSKIVYFRQILKLSTNVGVAVPEERYFTINDEIRGFFSPTLKGSKSIALKAESDLSFDKSILQTKAMTYIFADMAWISENKQPVFKNSVYQYGVGLGLRLRNVNVGVPHVDVQLSFYPRGKDFGQTLLGVAVYGSNPNAIQQKNMFVE